MAIIYVLIVVPIAIVIGLVVLFNTLTRKRLMVRNGWADIDVQLRRRSDLIPQLVNTVQGYAAHEKELFEDVIAQRNAAGAAGDDPSARGAAESALSKPVTRLLAVAEDYPDLKASDNFLQLQNSLAETEDKIEMARRFYNGAVREMNVAAQSFPGNLVAGMFGFFTATFFEIEPAARAVPRIDLGGADT